MSWHDRAGDPSLSAYDMDTRLSEGAKQKLWERIDASIDAGLQPAMDRPHSRAGRGYWPLVLAAAAGIIAAVGLGMWLRQGTDASGLATAKNREFMAADELDGAEPTQVVAPQLLRAPTLEAGNRDELPSLHESPLTDPTIDVAVPASPATDGRDVPAASEPRSTDSIDAVTTQEPGNGSEPTGKRDRSRSENRKPKASIAKPSTGLHEEIRLLRHARAALREGQPREALRWLDRHTQEFPSGQLAEDRRTLTAAALCASGRLREGRRLLRQTGPSRSKARLWQLCQDDRKSGTDREPSDE